MDKFLRFNDNLSCYTILELVIVLKKGVNMIFDYDTIRRIYIRTDGRCHICRKKLILKNYTAIGLRGSWEVDHSRAQAIGGSDNINNLYPACISCNRSKGTVSSRSVRAVHGFKSAPLSRERKKEAKSNNAVIGAIIGGIFGIFIGPWWVLVGGGIGAAIGYDINPEKL
jgi:hypothetical protein